MGNLTLNAESAGAIFSSATNVSWSNIDNPLTPMFSPPDDDNASLEDNPCFSINAGDVSADVVVAVNVLKSVTDLTTKSPRLASLPFRTLNELPTSKPWASVQLNVVIPPLWDADEIDTQGPKSITCWPTNTVSLAVFLTLTTLVAVTELIR